MISSVCQLSSSVSLLSVFLPIRRRDMGRLTVRSLVAPFPNKSPRAACCVSFFSPAASSFFVSICCFPGVKHQKLDSALTVRKRPRCAFPHQSPSAVHLSFCLLFTRAPPLIHLPPSTSSTVSVFVQPTMHLCVQLCTSCCAIHLPRFTSNTAFSPPHHLLPCTDPSCPLNPHSA